MIPAGTGLSNDPDRNDVDGQHTERVPEHEGEVVVLLSLLAELQKSGLARSRVHELYDERVDLAVLMDAQV